MEKLYKEEDIKNTQHIISNLCYTSVHGWYVRNNGHRVKMKMTPIKVSCICSDPSHMKSETERRQHVSEAARNDMKMVI